MNVEHLRCNAKNITKKDKQEYHYFYMYGSHCTTVPYFGENKFPLCFKWNRTKHNIHWIIYRMGDKHP